MKKKKLAVIGSGPASLMALSMLKDEFEVYLFEKPSRNNILGKRILVSGNGRANFFNEDLLVKKGAEEMLSYLRLNLHFAYSKEGKLYYPYFNRSECLHSVLIERISGNKNIHVLFSEVLSLLPQKNLLFYLKDGRKESLVYDICIFAPGGRSYDRDDFSYRLLDSLGVSYKAFEPLLCPVRVKEQIPSYLDKNRLRCALSLCCDKTTIYTEKGEVLFKKDGISGICVFDSTLYLRKKFQKNKDYVYVLDYSQGNLGKEDVDSTPFFLKRYLKEKNILFPSPLSFTFLDFYPFSASQVSYGGILASERNEDLSLVKHRNIFALGEVMNNNYICGGYNMGNAMLEGFLCGKELIQNGR